MKITKYPQACLLIETDNKRILVDPGNINLQDRYINEDWKNIDVILVTHRHRDHCDIDAINAIINRDNSILYTSNEVIEKTGLNGTKVKENDIINLGEINIYVVKAVHGFLPSMKQTDSEILENLGYIIDDGKIRLYITSDTICFNNEYECDVVCMPFNGNGLTIGMYEAPMFIKDLNAKLVIPIHFEHPTLKVDKEKLIKMFLENNIEYELLNDEESIEI